MSISQSWSTKPKAGCDRRWAKHEEHSGDEAFGKTRHPGGSSTDKAIEQAPLHQQASSDSDGDLHTRGGRADKGPHHAKASQPAAGGTDQVKRCKQEPDKEGETTTGAAPARVPIRSKAQWDAMPPDERLERARKRADFWAAEVARASQEVCGEKECRGSSEPHRGV